MSVNLTEQVPAFRIDDDVLERLWRGVEAKWAGEEPAMNKLTVRETVRIAGRIVGRSNRRIRFAVTLGSSRSHCVIRSRHGVQAAQPPRRHPRRRVRPADGPPHRLDVQLQSPGDLLLRHILHQMQVSNLGPLRHPDHLHVLLVQSTRRPLSPRR